MKLSDWWIKVLFFLIRSPAEFKILFSLHFPQGINDTEINFMLENVKKIWQRFLYRDSILLEGERQKTVFGHVKVWAKELSQLKEDDVFATLVQVPSIFLTENCHCKSTNLADNISSGNTDL